MGHEPGLFEVMYSTRAMRRLKADPVPDQILVKLIEAANQAPSGSNLQNACWLVIKDPEQQRRVAELNRHAVEAYLKNQWYGPPELPHPDVDKRKRFLDAVRWQMRHMHEVPALIAACLEMGRAPRDSFASVAGAAGSIWPGVQNLLLAARALGLGATPTTLGLGNRAAFKEVVGLPESIEPFCVIPVGYSWGKFGPVTRSRWKRSCAGTAGPGAQEGRLRGLTAPVRRTVGNHPIGAREGRTGLGA